MPLSAQYIFFFMVAPMWPPLSFFWASLTSRQLISVGFGARVTFNRYLNGQHGWWNLSGCWLDMLFRFPSSSSWPIQSVFSLTGVPHLYIDKLWLNPVFFWGGWATPWPWPSIFSWCHGWIKWPHITPHWIFHDFPASLQPTSFAKHKQRSCSILLMAPTSDVWNPVNNGINYLSTGAGYQPSTVSYW